MAGRATLTGSFDTIARRLRTGRKIMTNRQRAIGWLKQQLFVADDDPGEDCDCADTLAALLDAVDAEATKRSADVVRTLIADLHEDMDPALAAVIRKALGHAVKKIEAAQGEVSDAP